MKGFSSFLLLSGMVAVASHSELENISRITMTIQDVYNFLENNTTEEGDDTVYHCKIVDARYPQTLFTYNNQIQQGILHLALQKVYDKGSNCIFGRKGGKIFILYEDDKNQNEELANAYLKAASVE